VTFQKLVFQFRSEGGLTLLYSRRPNVYNQKDIDPGEMKFITEKTNLSHEPAENWKSVDYYMPVVPVGEQHESGDFSRADSNSLRGGGIANTVRRSEFVAGNTILKSLIAVTERPSGFRSLHDVQVNEFKNEIQCFLYVCLQKNHCALCAETFGK
jgi:hypothetical protein